MWRQLEYSTSLEFVAFNLGEISEYRAQTKILPRLQKTDLTTPKAADRIPSTNTALSITNLYTSTRPPSPLKAPFRVSTYLTGSPSIMATALAVGFGIATAAFLVHCSPNFLLPRTQILTMTVPSGSRWLSSPPKIPRRRQRHGPRFL